MKELSTAASRTTDIGTYSDKLTFWLNGQRTEIWNPDPTMMLTDYLNEVGVTGTKVGCGQGGCGACTVMISRRDPRNGEPVHRAINACLRPLCALDGMMVTTTEGIGSVHEGLDPTQFCIAQYNGSQCGFCTPGFVMNTFAYLQEHPQATQQDIEDIYGGNLCRCTGYRPILHGMRTLACDYNASCDQTQKCEIDPGFEIRAKEKLTEISLEQLPSHNRAAVPLHFTGSGREWFRPISLHDVHALKKALVEKTNRESVKLVFGNTASGVYQSEKPTYFIDISVIHELGEISSNKDGIKCGAAVPIQRLMDYAKEIIAAHPEEKTKGLKALVYHASFIAGLQVRSAGSVAGNIFMTRDHSHRGGAFPSDLYTVLSSLGTTVSVGSLSYDGGSKEFLLIELPAVDALPEDAVLVSFHIPFSNYHEYVQTYRIARRAQMAHPIVNAGFRFAFDDNGVVKPDGATIIYGGLAAMIYRADQTEQFLIGKPWNNETLKQAMAILRKEVLECTVPMGEEEGIFIDYRLRLAESFFYKFFLHAALQLNPKDVADINASAGYHDIRPLSTGTQEYYEYPEVFPVTKSIIKRAAFVQASGEIRYTQDVALPKNGWHGAMVKSTRPHAKFTWTKNVNGLEALKELLKKQFPGFMDLITVEDIPERGEKKIGLGDDDPIFCEGKVTSVGAPVGMVLAETIATARDAAEFIEKECVAYEDLHAVITMADAQKNNTVMPIIRKESDEDADIQQRMPTITRDGSNMEWLNNPRTPLPDCEIAYGIIRTPAQAHFYLETNCALVIPGPYDQITVYSSTQNPNGTQSFVAKALGIQANQVTVLVEQIGGGFGGKQHRGGIVAAQAAVAARKVNRPVRLLFDRATDMQMIGKRHPYEGGYHVAYTKDGMIQAIRLDISSDAGDTYDCTFAVLDLSLLQADGCYFVPTMQANGTAYATNKTSNTAFRTFGVVQAWTILESVIERVAFELSKSTGRHVTPEEVRLKNMYRNGTFDDCDKTHFGQELDFCNIREMWDYLYKTSDFERREKEVREFNQKHRWRKRGIVMVPQKHGIAFTEPRGSLNSASALVNVNMSDGSVVIYHGGVEMGQGLHTKIAQLASNTLGIPLDKIRIGGNNTDSILNCPATAASTGYDLNGGAVEKACRVLRTRLEDFCRDLEQFHPHNRIEDWRTKWSEKWNEIVFKAWFNRINLSAAELYKTPHYKGPSERNPQGAPFLYFSYGIAATEVEIDVLTGEFKIIRADTMADGCKSPNPAIDIGQLEGGFIQGVGYATTEECVYDHDGRLITDNIWSYKPPCTKTIPIDFRATLYPVDEKRNQLEALAEKHAVKSSKSFTESSLTLGASTYFALIHAIKAARIDQTGKNEWIDMDLPLTCQRIQGLCAVSPDKLEL